MRRRRRLILSSLFLVAFIGISLIVLRLYLRSDGVLRDTISRLEAIYGGPVRLERVEIGSSGTSLFGLQLLEAEAGPSDSPWLTARQISTDVTLIDLIAGSAAPQQITVTGAAVVIRLDTQGKLLTRFPRSREGSGAFPTIRFLDSQITLRQQGRADMVVAGIEAELLPDSDRLVVSGSVKDSYWGDWALSGEVNPSTGKSDLNLSASRAQVTQDKLRALALVPPSVWEQVQAEGNTSVDFTLRFDPKAGGVHYCVDLAPEKANLHIAAIDLKAEQVTGQVVIENGQVALRNLVGVVAGGEAETSGDLDFRKGQAQLALSVAVRKVDVRRLPASWAIPEQLEGRLAGKVQLRIEIDGRQTRVDGEGQGEITEARIAGIAAAPLDLRIRSGCLEAALVWEKVDLETLARNLGQKAGLPLGGSFTLHTQAAFPLNTLRDRRTYCAQGTLQSDRLLMNQVPVEKIEANLRLQAGVLSITGMQGFLEGLPILGGAQVELDDSLRYHAHLDLRHGDLAVLHRVVPELRPALDIEGRVTLSADLRGTLKPFSFSASGTGRASPLHLETLRVDKAEFAWNTDGHTVTLSRLEAALYDGRLSGTFLVPLRSSAPGSMKLEFEGLNLETLDTDVPGLPFELEGRLKGTLEGQFLPGGPGRPPDYSARIETQASRMRIRGLPAEEVRASIDYRRSAVDYTCQGQTLGGRFVLQGRLPSRGMGTASTPAGRLRMQGIQLARLWPELGAPDALQQLDASIDLEIGFKHDQEGGPPSAGGRITMRRLRWDESEVAEALSGSLAITAGEIRLRDFSGTLGEGLFNGQVAIDLKNPERSGFNLTLQQVEASRLLTPWPGWAERVQGPIDLRLRGTLGREWTGEGRLSLVRGKMGEVEVADLQAPIDLVFSPRFGNGQFHLREGGAQVAQGRATARASFSWGNGTRLEGQVRFFGVDLRTLLRQALDLPQVGGGRVSGRVDFNGNDLRSLDDLTASMEATFAQTQMLELPVLRQLLPYLLPGQTTSPVFQSGELRAHLSRGVVRVQRLTLTAPLLQVLLEGTLTLQGRLDMNVTANNFPTNRLVRLRMSGTTRSPQVQVEPLPALIGR